MQFLNYKPYGIFLGQNFLGCYKNFVQLLNLRGMGYKVLLVKSTLVLKLSQSHRLVYTLKKNLKVLYINKQILKVLSKSLNLLKKVIYFLQKYGKINTYKKKGIFFKGSIVSLKISSKKSKF